MVNNTGDSVRYEIWMEGYLVTGMEGRPVEAHLVAVEYAETFKEACIKFFKHPDDKNLFNKENLTYWGCKLFDNEADARKSFG